MRNCVTVSFEIKKNIKKIRNHVEVKHKHKKNIKKTLTTVEKVKNFNHLILKV